MTKEAEELLEARGIAWKLKNLIDGAAYAKHVVATWFTTIDKWGYKHPGVPPDPMGPLRSQLMWHEFVERLGESGARALLAARLREAADMVEKDENPYVFGCEIPKNGICKDSFIDTVSVTLSYPWPG